MAQRLVEGVAHLVQIVCHRHVIDLQTEGKGVDEHPHRIGNLQIGAPATDGAQINLTVIGVTRDHITCSGKEQVRWCYCLLKAEGCRFVVICWADSLTDEALFICHRQVGWNLTRTLAGL